MSALDRLAVDSPEELYLRAQPFHRTFFRFALVLGRQLVANVLAQRAGALTYTTILSIFPILLLVIASASFFFTPDRQDLLLNQVQEFLYPKGEVIAVGDKAPVDESQVQENMDKLRTIVKDGSESFRSKATGLGIAGFVAMLLAAYGLYNAVENAMDSTWRGSGSRSFKRTFTTFATLLLVTPIAIGASLTVTTVATTAKGFVEAGRQEAVESGEARAMESLRRKTWETTAAVMEKVGFLIPTLLNGLFFSLAYFFVPSARVKWRAALVGGLVAGVLWELSKAGFATYVFSSAINREIFASLGVIPIFLIWIYFTWAIFLLGNEIAYVSQNFYALAADQFLKRPMVPYDARLLVAALLAIHHEFGLGNGAASGSAIARLLRLRRAEMDAIFDELVRSGYVARTGSDGILPQVPADKVRIGDIVRLGQPSGAIATVEGRALATVIPALRILEARFAGSFTSQENLAELMASPETENPANASRAS